MFQSNKNLIIKRKINLNIKWISFYIDKDSEGIHSDKLYWQMDVIVISKGN